MSRYRLVSLSMTLLVTTLCACGPQLAPQITPEPSATPASQSGDFESYEQLVGALRDAGATVKPIREAVQPFFAVPTQIIEVNGLEVQVFEYPDTAARQEDSHLISPDGYTIGTSKVTWVDRPHFWAHGRLIVLYVGSDRSILGLLTSILGEPVTSGD
jgi:hypothetical protein